MDGSIFNQNSGRDLYKTQATSVDLTSESNLYITDKHLTKFEIADSQISQEIDKIHARECFTGRAFNSQNPTDNS